MRAPPRRWHLAGVERQNASRANRDAAWRHPTTRGTGSRDETTRRKGARLSQRKARQARRAGQPASHPSRPGRRRAGDQGRNTLKWFAIAAAAALAVAGIVAVTVLRGSGGGGGVAAAGEPAPSVEGADPITGEAISLSDFAGKPVVINVWASWCPGCNDEAEDLATLAKEHPEAQLLGIDYQDTAAGARAFYRRWSWEHPSIFDPDGSLAARFGLVGLPMTFFLDADHRVVARIVGAGTLSEFESGLRRAIAS